MAAPAPYAAEREDRKNAQAGLLAGPAIIVPPPMLLSPRRQHANIGVMGEPGAGKTYAALLTACLLRRLDQDTRPILVIDIQNGQVADEARTFQREYGGDGPIVWLDWLSIDPTCHPRSMLRWLQEHVHEYAAIVVDPFSRVWTGALRLKENLTAAKFMGGDEYAAWKPITDWDGCWTQVMELVQAAPCHMVVTARMKEKNRKEGREWTSLGLLPQWREETTYELGVVVEVLRPTDGKTYRHQVWRTRGDQPFTPMSPSEKLGEFIAAYHGWLTAADADTFVPYANPIVGERWAAIAAEWKDQLPTDMKDRARPLLILAGLLSERGTTRPNPSSAYTPPDLDAWEKIVDRARAETGLSATDSPAVTEPPPTERLIETGDGAGTGRVPLGSRARASDQGQS